MKRRRLPIGTQSFRVLRGDGSYYVDKTAYILKLLDEGRHYFLSRPRRFGKSLFLDTLRELFEGSESLFRGLHIHDRWDWSVRYPVVRLSFDHGLFYKPGYIHTNLTAQLDDLEQTAGVEPRHETGPERLAHLIRSLHRRSGQRTAVLVDEYDKPVLDALDEPEVAKANRDYLRGLYGVVKGCDEHIRFTFITGVSKFSKVSLFSGLNSLEDITLDPRYSAICGYTEADLDEVFAPELAGLDRDEIRRWYNGYRWRGTEGVYNPFDLLLLFKRREFEPHWFETGTPTFLPELLLRRRVGPPELELMAADKDLLSKFDVGDIGTEALLFQTGYLTIKGERREGWQTRYTLGYPNMEVRLALNKKLLQTMLPAAALRVADAARLGALLTAGDLKGLERQLRKLFQSIPTDWHRKNKITEYEGYYAAVVLAWFHTQQLRAVAEDSGSGGRADLTLLHERGTYVFEFKVAGRGAAETALKQIKAKGYADKYLDAGRPVYLVGVEFSPETRNVERFDTERVQ